MASLIEELVEALLADAGVSALVDDRVHPHAPENSARPLIVYDVETLPDLETDHFGGQGLMRSTVTLSSIADTPGQAEAVSTALRTMLTDFSGALTAQQSVQRVRFTGARYAGFSEISTGQQWDTDFEFIHT